MSSADAASYLIEHWPKSHRATFLLIRHRSWKTADQTRLAEHFLSKRAFADPFPYEVFASFMSLPRFLATIERIWPDNPRDLHLLTYHLWPILAGYAEKSEANEIAIRRFREARQSPK